MPQDFDSEVLYVVLKNAIAKDVIVQIKPFLGTGSVCVELTKPNAVLISDERSNIPKLKQLLEIVDMNGYEQWPRAVMVCNNIIPSQVVEELRKVLPVLGFYVQASDNRTGTAANNRNTATQPGAIQLSAIDRLQLIVASAATEEAIAEIRQWVEILDNANSLDEERVFVYKVRHGKADQLAKALAVIYNLSGQSLTIDTETGNNKVENISASSGNTTTVRRTTNNNNQNQTTNTDAGQAGSIFENTVKLFADGVLNRLVIRTTPRTYASMKAVLDRLDIVPAQVLLQVLLVEVTLTEATKFGVEFSATGEWMGDNMVLGNTYDNLNPDLTGGGVRKEGGATILLTDPSNPQNKFAYLKALAGNNLLEIVASPQLLVSSHNQAVINVGAKVPITSQSLTSSDSSNIVQNVEYEDTGAILTVTPQITSTDLIGLELKQELSEAVVNTVSNIDSPQITTRTLETTMTIKNGATMIIGGMIQKKKKDDLAGLPLVNNIPLLRRLFGSTDSSVERTELLVLITGYIVDEKSDVEEMINRYDEAVKALNEFCSDLGDSQEKNKSAAVKNNSVAGTGK